MTRHQVWRARERARFLVIAEAARCTRLAREIKAATGASLTNPSPRLRDAREKLRRAQITANFFGIPEAFTG